MAFRHPEDFLLDRYLPDADEEARDIAREDFRRFVKVLLDIATDIAEREMAAADSPKLGGRPTISSVP